MLYPDTALISVHVDFERSLDGASFALFKIDGLRSVFFALEGFVQVFATILNLINGIILLLLR